MKRIILATSLLLAILFIGCSKEQSSEANDQLVIEKQGYFTVGGHQIVRDGVYDGSTFTGFFTVNEAGQTMNVDHAYVEYQIPVGAQPYSMIYVHGYGGSGMTWTSTPDGREGFTTLMLRHGYPSYVMDLPGRGRAAKTSVETTITP